jgi:hypothetical protein
MLCPVCHGTKLRKEATAITPCPECEGRGEIHCCEGLVEHAPCPGGDRAAAAPRDLPGRRGDVSP